MPGAVCVVIMGAKAVGKSWVADVLERHFGVYHVDADTLVLDLVAHTQTPDKGLGWLTPVEAALVQALTLHDAVSVEATGAWDSDWMLLDRLRHRGVTVRTIWVHAALDQSLARLAARTTPKVPISETEARRIYAESTRRAAKASFDLVVDASGEPDETLLVEQVGSLLHD